MIIVVERSESDLFEYLSRRFEQITDVQVILDRRQPGSREVTWHAVDRRQPSDADEHLRSRGYVIIREPRGSSPSRGGWVRWD